MFYYWRGSNLVIFYNSPNHQIRVLPHNFLLYGILSFSAADSPSCCARDCYSLLNRNTGSTTKISWINMILFLSYSVVYVRRRDLRISRRVDWSQDERQDGSGNEDWVPISYVGMQGNLKICPFSNSEFHPYRCHVLLNRPCFYLSEALWAPPLSTWTRTHSYYAPLKISLFTHPCLHGSRPTLPIHPPLPK